MQVSEFHYELPEELIAQRPAEMRGMSRMLTLDRKTGIFADHGFRELPALLRPGDLLVLNDSRVIPARLYARRSGRMAPTRGAELVSNAAQLEQAPKGLVEVLLTERLSGASAARPMVETDRSSAEGQEWSALVKPARKVPVGETLLFSAAGSDEVLLRATVTGAGEFGERRLRFDPVEEFYAVLERIGRLPLPPYIHREKDVPDREEDRERYQTVYSHPLSRGDEAGSAAAPTAGLHFTAEILAELRERGVEIAPLTLHVGLGTFQPVRVSRTEEIRLHAEGYTISAETAEAVNRARAEGRRIVAVGTTSTRTLEHVAREAEARGAEIESAFWPHSGSTSLFLSPGAEFKVVSGLLTNFHLPESTLLMLVSAFAGRERVLAAYAHAIRRRYRFFSYGDCMLIT
ncbi:MAG: tRNA preQ1(34) S-adenosylmethionine ribosyltransferase-isomerase QueA [Acidobacteriota bacterium]